MENERKYWLCITIGEYLGICINESLWGVHKGYKSILEETNIGDKIIFYVAAKRTDSDRALKHGSSFLLGTFEITTNTKETPSNIKWSQEFPFCVSINRIEKIEKKIRLVSLSEILRISPRDLGIRLEGEDMIELIKEQFEYLKNNLY